MNNTSSPKKPKSNKGLIAIAAGTVLALSTVAGVQAFTNSKTYAHYQVEANAGSGPGAMLASWRGGKHHRGGWHNLSDEEIESRIERIVKHAGIEIDATPQQQEKITALLTAASKEIKPMRTKMRETRKQVHELMLADTIDRTALERLRAERLSDMDEVSKKLVDTMADVAEVLTAEQRVLLEERIKEFRSFRKGWRRG